MTPDAPDDAAPWLEHHRVTVVAPLVPGFRWGGEAAGLYTVLVEAGLQDLGGVSSQVEGTLASPGTRATPRAATEWQALLVLEGESEAHVDYRLTLCDADGDCSEASSSGPARKPETWLPPLLTQVAARIGAPPATGARNQWARPLSDDDYAILLTGRAAATVYGMMERKPGTEPVARAVKVDPGIAVSQWLASRERLLADDPVRARQHASAAAAVQPSSPALRADQAVLLGLIGKPLPAFRAWERLHGVQPVDPRWGLATARAALAAGELDEAEALGAQLAVAFPDDAEVARLRVRVLEAVGDQPDYDDRLANWAARDRAAAEPVRRRVLLAVREKRYEDAWTHLDALDERDPTLAQRLRVPVGIALGRTEVAAIAADGWDADLAAAVRAGSAPGPDEQAAALRALDARIDGLGELGTDAMQRQNRIAEARAVGGDRCAGEADAAARLRQSLLDWRADLEAARGQAAELSTLLAHPSLVALDDRRAQADAGRLAVQLERQVSNYRSTVTWTQRHLGGGCRG